MKIQCPECHNVEKLENSDITIVIKHKDTMIGPPNSIPHLVFEFRCGNCEIKESVGFIIDSYE